MSKSKQFGQIHKSNLIKRIHIVQNKGKNDDMIEWVAVRPDGLIDEDEVTEYELHPSPIRGAIVDAGSHPILAYQHESSATANGVNQPKIRTILSSQK